MPDTGDVPPALTLVAVRAIVPVTQMPPNSAEPILPTPCATSSILERCLRPVMLSATTADNRLSILPSSVKATASGSTAMILSKARSGICGAGNKLGMPPNFEPIVSRLTPSFDSATAIKPEATIVISRPGQWGRYLRHHRISPIDRPLTSIAAGLMVPMAAAIALNLGISAPGSRPASCSPNRSTSWLQKMITAIPEVKPTVTGCGIYLMIAPSLKKPKASIITPDSSTASISPSMPCRSMVTETSTMKAPAGPPIW